MQITKEFKTKVVDALLIQRNNFTEGDRYFAAQFELKPAIFSRLKKKETEGLLRPAEWLRLGKRLEVTLNEKPWNFARTVVYEEIEEDVMDCQQHSIAKIYVDECAIGKTFAAKHLSRTLTNCFYVDASQAKTKQRFIRMLAQRIGLDSNGRYSEVIDTIKAHLSYLPKPIIIIDEAGDLEYPAFLELKELWNATEGTCGWYMLGAEGFENKIHRGIRSKKVGYREIFSRFNARFASLVPIDQRRRFEFYKELVWKVLEVNVDDRNTLPELVEKCLIEDMTGQIGGLRRARTILLINQA